MKVARIARALMQIQDAYINRHPHHIPLLFMLDVIHGYRTIFPAPIAQGASFDPEISKRAASVAARETSAAGIHVVFSPMVDLVRDPRWGACHGVHRRRSISEQPLCCGTDPWLSGRRYERGWEGVRLYLAFCRIWRCRGRKGI